MVQRLRVRVALAAGAALFGLVGAWSSVTASAAPAAAAAQTSGHVTTSANAHHDTSPALRDLKDTHTRGTAHPALHLPRHGGQSDVRGSATGSGGGSAALVPSTSTNWEGVGQGFSGPNGTFLVNSAPPDTDGAVGPSDYVQIVNESFAVFNKTGTVLYGPVSTNTLWSGFGGLCQSDNDGDATVVYDRAADRFVISQFAITGANGSTTSYLQCVAVSSTGDPTGSYHRYSFTYSNFPDYPKLSVWPDAYYTTFNMFDSTGTIFFGAEVAAYNRSAMLNGQSATQQTFSTSSTYGGLLGANVDSAALPAAGTPEWIVALGASSSQLAYWKFHVDWTNPGASTVTGPATLATQTWSELCGGGTCVPQSGTTQRLDSLADRVMYNLGYRSFADHESLVISHSVVAGSGGGVAWYELRPSGGNLSIYQQGIYAPDSNYRWMPSLAMDGSGDIGLGFSLSGSSLHPAIHYSGRLAGDPLGTMSQGEASIIDGAGSQSGSNLSRWGDYSQMSIDPSDDCTFWYTNEYEAASGAFNWHTRIGSFKFAGCGGTVTNDFSMSVSPTGQSVTAGGSASYTVTTAVTSGSATTVSLSASGLPAGASASFNPASVTAGGSSTMTVTTSSTTPAGTSTITVTGTGSGGSPVHTATTGLTVNAPPANDFSISVSPSTQTVTAGSGTQPPYTVSTAVTSGSAVTVSLSASGLPAGATASFNPASVTAGQSSALTISTATSTAAGSYTFTVTGTGPGGAPSHQATAMLIVNAPPGTNPIVNGDFETGTLSGWTASGSAYGVNSSVVHSGTYSALLGSTRRSNGTSSLAQTFTMPSGVTTLTFWFDQTCVNSSSDYGSVTLQDNGTGVTTTVWKACATSGWTQITFNITAFIGHSVTLTLSDRANKDATRTYFDDVAIA